MMLRRPEALGPRKGVRHGRSAAVWVVFATIACLWLAAVVVALPRTTNPLDLGDVLWASSFLVLVALGRFVVARRPHDVFGWLLLVGTLALASRTAVSR